jgi:hypothetical protein
MFRILYLMAVLLLNLVIMQAQSVTGTFQNAVNASPDTAGTLSLYNMNAQQWVFQQQTSGYQTMIFNDIDYRIHTDQDRLSLSNDLFKHHLWDHEVDEYALANEFSVSQGVH